MYTKTSVIGVAMGLVMTVALSQAAGFDIPYKGTISGSFISTEIDAIPGDGVKAILGLFAVTTRNLGQVTAQALVEDVLATSPSGLCPPGTDQELALGIVRAVHRFANGDLLFLKLLARTACIDFQTLTALAFEKGEFTGGTGRFAQATGSFTATSTGEIFVADPAGRVFGPFSGKINGTISLPTPVPHGGE
jgi:hypothetical protein